MRRSLWEQGLPWIAATYGPPILYAYCIFLLSSRSFESVPGAPGIDKLAHLLLYAGLGYWVLRALKKSGVTRSAPALTVCLVLLYGFSDEGHQFFVPGRQFDLWDLFFDGLGGFLAVCLGQWADRRGWPVWF